MTGFNHGMTGALIALTVKQPVLAVPLAFLSHFAQDLIPHFGVPDESLFSRKFDIGLAADFLFSVGLMIILALLFPAHKWLIWTCMIAAACPDLIWAYYFLYKQHIKKQKLHFDPIASFHLKLQWSQSTLGGLVELAWFLGCWTVVLIIR